MKSSRIRQMAAPCVASLAIFGLAGVPAFGEPVNGVVIEITGAGDPAAPAQRGPMECNDAPTCVPLQVASVSTLFDSEGLGSYLLRYELDSPCPAPRSLIFEIFYDGVLISDSSTTTNATSPIALTISGSVNLFPDGEVIHELRVTDLTTFESSSCVTTITGFCGEDPVCNAVPMIEVRPFGDTAMLEYEFGPGCPPFPSDLSLRLVKDGTETIFDNTSFGVTQNTVVTSGPFVDLAPGESSFFTLKVEDRDSAAMSECTIEVRACDSPVICSLDGDDSNMHGPMRVYDVLPGDTLDVLEVCAESACGGAARVEMFARPPFMEPAGHRKSAEGEAACIETKSGDVVESGYAEGTYWAKFRCEDLLTGDVRELKVGYRYTDPGPDPDVNPALACAEDESAGTNDKYNTASAIDAGLCASEGGVGIFGTLDVPMVINGDVDYFRITGLSPGAVHTAMIAAGANGAQGYTDTMLGWFAADGVLVTSDDNGGPREVFSRIEFVADDAGMATLAVTGHGDDDFNGIMDPAMPYGEYGFGDYMLLVREVGVDIDDLPLERQADLNGDGVVNTADLGLLIGVFGATN